MGTHLTACFFPGFSIGDGMSFVEFAPAPGESELDLGAPVLEVGRERDESKRPVLGLPAQFADLSFVQ
jgi:hypothetical protein